MLHLDLVEEFLLPLFPRHSGFPMQPLGLPRPHHADRQFLLMSSAQQMISIVTRLPYLEMQRAYNPKSHHRYTPHY